ncbi:two-component system regulatory protein YycI [Paenibacillus filicis]|uniref:Two-component system regulatory protein YycI n=1 Tax=Paenibacillus gyeongsangnamensis TaxID=3388067 RepID=A0ABT4QL87_9BACL|nr:two-component system regulatory protein YycI [Paenibacillus filicis]MCZ8517633.1 two-component system regulatory protein YycI [Paenibacillus filicis]
MEWGRAKTILILSFLLLNVVLGVQLWSSRSDLLDLEASTSGAAAQELQRLLKSKNIQVPADIPKDVPKLKEIVAKFDEKLTPGLPVTLAAPFKFDPLISKSSGKDLMVRAGIPKADSYQFDPALSSNGKFVFHQLYGGFPMFEVQLELIEKNGLIAAYKQGFVEIKAEGDQKEQKVISPYTALQTLIENYLPAGSVITGVKLGYHGQMYNSQTLNMWPSWRVTIGNSSGDVYFVHAFSGAVEGPQKNK